MSFFTDVSRESEDLSWLNIMVHEELKQSMIIGALDNVDPAIAYIQYVPLNLDLIESTDQDGLQNTGNNAAIGEEDPGDTELSSGPAWWIVAGFGFIGLAVVFLVLYRKRRNYVNDISEFGSTQRSPKKGSFPVQIEILDDNSEFDHDEIYKDDDEEEKEEEDVIVAKPPSWRQVREEPLSAERSEFLRLDINATDPNQPVVKPVLDEEAETYISTV